MTRPIKYTMTSKEALIKAIDLVIDANIPGLKAHCALPVRDNLVADPSQGSVIGLSFQWDLAFAIGVTMYVDFKDRWRDDNDHPSTVVVKFSYSGTTHGISSAMAINELHRKVVAVGATIDAVLSQETIKSARLTWKEENLEKEKYEARARYQELLARTIGEVIPIGDVDKHDVGFLLKEGAKKTTFLCSASVRGTSKPCGKIAKHAVWTSRAWGARCGHHYSCLETEADPVVDLLEDYKNDYTKEFLMSKGEDADGIRDEL